jgi:hypothetical protein
LVDPFFVVLAGFSLGFAALAFLDASGAGFFVSAFGGEPTFGLDVSEDFGDELSVDFGAAFASIIGGFTGPFLLSSVIRTFL